ncbi:MAG: DinB family protein [Anaerolineales bacterium]
MTGKPSEWKDTLVNLFALASRLEGDGQYNLAKLARATADSLSRQAAYELEIPTRKDELAAAIKKAAGELSSFEVNPDVIAALTQGADVMAYGRLPLIDVTPNAYVCRTCGHVVLQEPVENCPTCGAWPSTFQQFLPVYWLNALEPVSAMERLRQTPIEVEKLLDGLTDAEMNLPPEDGGWAIRNTLSHLRDAQGLLSFRLDLFLTQEHPVLESKAVFSWATSEDDRPPSVREIFETYNASRQKTLQKLEALPLADWWKTGEHEEFGTMTLRQQVSYFASHELTHLPQIDKLRRQFLK